MIQGVAWLFCPADRPERFAKAAARADVVILDLEDGVAARDRPAARVALAAEVLDPDRTVVRINALGTPDHGLDLAALAPLPYSHLMLAKTDSPDGLAALAPRRVIALCETPRGILAASDIAGSPHVDALMWGAEDLVAALGGSSSRYSDGSYREVARHARSSVLLAAGAAGVCALDSVYVDITDLSGLQAESEDASASGFAAKACIHPSQVPVVRRAFRPSEAAVARARRILAAALEQRGVFAFEGQMVDEPLLHHARRLVALAGDGSAPEDAARG